MKLLKMALLAAMLTFIIFAGGTPDTSWAEAQASTPVTNSTPARNTATSREDITLTNNCIENGKEKIYCLCVTKIFKNAMTLRQYRGVVALYGKDNTPDVQNGLADKGYSAHEVTSINILKKDLVSEDKFRTRCDRAEIYFSASTEG